MKLRKNVYYLVTYYTFSTTEDNGILSLFRFDKTIDSKW